MERSGGYIVGVVEGSNQDIWMTKMAACVYIACMSSCPSRIHLLHL